MLHKAEYPILEGNRKLALPNFKETDLFDYVEKHKVVERVFAQGGFNKQKRVPTKYFKVSCVWLYDNVQELISFFRDHQFKQLKLWYKNRFLFVDLTDYKIKEKGFYRALEVTMSFVCINPFWYHETVLMFSKNEVEKNGKHFPNVFPHHYGVGNTQSNVLEIPEYESTFILEMYGEVKKPAVNILQLGESITYNFNVELEKNDTLRIDSDKRRVILSKENKSEIDVFGLRDRTKNIFDSPLPGVIEIDSNCEGRLIIYNKDFHTQFGEKGVIYGRNNF